MFFKSVFNDYKAAVFTPRKFWERDKFQDNIFLMLTPLFVLTGMTMLFGRHLSGNTWTLSIVHGIAESARYVAYYLLAEPLVFAFSLKYKPDASRRMNQVVVGYSFVPVLLAAAISNFQWFAVVYTACIWGICVYSKGVLRRIQLPQQLSAQFIVLSILLIIITMLITNRVINFFLEQLPL
ncbi:MAG: hypothetical protein LBR06_09405 [Bacteroidales bacterium]|jgi:uncharacterized membrane protein YwzB|nr:hypothetical protein [Bacteroidales bacterium]